MLMNHCGIKEDSEVDISFPTEKGFDAKILVLPIGDKRRTAKDSTIQRDIVTCLTVSGKDGHEIGGKPAERQRILEAWQKFILYDYNARVFKR